MTAVDTYLRHEADYRTSLLRRAANIKGAATVVHAVRVLRRLEGPLAAALREEIMGDPHDVAQSEEGGRGSYETGQGRGGVGAFKRWEQGKGGGGPSGCCTEGGH